MLSRFRKKDYLAMKWCAEEHKYRLTMTVYPEARFIKPDGTEVKRDIIGLVNEHNQWKKRKTGSS